MSATTLAAFIAIAAGYALSFWFLVQHFGNQLAGLESRLETRLERIEERLSAIEVELARIGQRLDDHIRDHPGPTQRLASSR